GPKIREKTSYLSFTFFLSVIVNISSLFIFIQLFELEGVVFSMIITNLFLVAMSWYLSNRLYYIPFSVPKFIVLIAPALTLAISMMFFEWSFLYRISIAVLCLGLYGFLLIGFYKRFKAL